MQEGAVFVEQARQMEAQICGALDAEEKWDLQEKMRPAHRPDWRPI